MWILPEHKTDRTGDPRIVYLAPAMIDLTKKLAERYPDGPLFRCSRKVDGIHQPWTYNAIRCRFRRLQKKQSQLKGLSAYVCRHIYATEVLGRGLSLPVVASLLENKSTRMLEEHYSHLDQMPKLLKEAAAKASRVDDSTFAGVVPPEPDIQPP